jgi:hypothetical protein
MSYDLGDLASITDPLGNTTNRLLDSAGGSKRGRESLLDEVAPGAISAMIKCRVDLVFQLVVLPTMS